MAKLGMSSWPTNSEAHAHMEMRQRQNLGSCAKSEAEEWMRRKLKSTGLKWTRQAQSGFFLMDFWNHRLGVDVEIDGPEHSEPLDARRDGEMIKRGILVFRVQNFNESEADTVVCAIGSTSTWNDRREAAGLSLIRT